VGGAADDEEEFGARLAGELTLVATLGGSAIGFAALADNTRIDMLYVHPAAAGQGAGRHAVRRAGEARGRRGTEELTSRRATRRAAFSSGAAYVPKTRNTVLRRRVARQHHDGQAARRYRRGRQRERVMKRPDMPFQRHWLYYLMLKYAVIAVAVVITFYTVYRLYSG
jgi:GNAT superfamily N-acetyltransferase